MADSPNRSNVASPAVSDRSGNKSRQENQSRQSGRVTFPNSVKSPTTSMLSEDEVIPSGNPFKMPQDSDIFMLRDRERQKKKQERLKQRQLRVHEKTTYASRVNFKTAAMIKPADSDEEKEEEEDSDKAVAVKDDPQFTIAVTRDRHVEKESLAEYIAKKREMFLVQYSLGVKRDEMRKLEEIAQAEERKLELAEQYLEEDAAMFDEFLKENDKNSVEAIRIAEAETKAKLEKVQEIKRINTLMMTIKSEISKYEDTLKEYQLYRRFLESLTPPEWKAEKEQARLKRREERRREKEKNLQNLKKSGSDMGSQAIDAKGKKKTVGKAGMQKTGSGTKRASEGDSLVSTADEDSDSDEDLELFFKDPQELLNIFAELEEQNLSLIQNSQETEEALEEMKQTIKNTKVKMEKETQILKEQIEKLNDQITKEEKKAEDLRMKSKLFSFGEFKAEDQELMLQQLNKKVEEVYRSCIGDNEANIRNDDLNDILLIISTLQMLTNIENRLEELFEQIESMPQEKVEAAEKAKEKERRLKLREEKMEQQRIHQEERVKRALERAKAEPKKQTGRKLVFRSEPPRLKKKEDLGADLASREEEELAYFFQW